MALVTYSINGMGGKEASGIPSLAVALSVARDFALYDEWAEDGEPFRREVTFEEVESDWEAGVKYMMLYVDGREWYGIHTETRCNECRRPL